MFKVGDLVKVRESVVETLEVEGVSGLLVVNELDGEWYGIPQFEVRNADGDYFGILETSLEAV